jgi:uncharacterized protein
MYFTIYVDANRQWRWRLQAANNRIIANSGESYHNRADCLAAISLVKGSGHAPIHN